MHIVSKRQRREAPFNCEKWSQLATNSAREAVEVGFVHDVYGAPFDGDFGGAVEALFAYKIFARDTFALRIVS